MPALSQDVGRASRDRGAAMATTSAAHQRAVRDRGAAGAAAVNCIGGLEHRAVALVPRVYRAALLGKLHIQARAAAIAAPAGSPNAGLHRYCGTLSGGEIGRALDAGDRRIRLPA